MGGHHPDAAMIHRRLSILALSLLTLALPLQAAALTSAEILAASKPEDWRRPEAENLLLMQLGGGKPPILIELAPAFAPKHVANIRALAREHYFDGLAVLREQDNYVAQWGDPDAEDAAKQKPMKTAQRSLPAEFARPIAGLAITPLKDGTSTPPPSVMCRASRSPPAGSSAKPGSPTATPWSVLVAAIPPTAAAAPSCTP